jgi:hypothetical protein
VVSRLRNSNLLREIKEVARKTMNYDPENISMQAWLNLTERMQGVVDQALQHLAGQITVNPEESQAIVRWQNALREQHALIDEIKVGYSQGRFNEPAPEEANAFVVLDDQVEQLEQQLATLSVMDLGRVEPILNSLQSHVQNFVSAGPHGPGGGKPRGPGSGGVG